ncbi:uncharacterized protein LOC133554348 isoform X2 [Nerophis ophidion]|uniref:uncharacterized protein LOC133554348 isoform X2 n=1 Tax=Nerophis ophidion TaxID=159077 RepID=UPI002ADFBD03|nr:uncharacterized protein LOC133554348 isoform X2 [Nerophis ophidion]
MVWPKLGLISQGRCAHLHKALSPTLNLLATHSEPRQQRSGLYLCHHRGRRGSRRHRRLHAGEPERLQLRQRQAGLLQQGPGLEVGGLLGGHRLRPGILQSLHRRPGGQTERQDADEPPQQRGGTQGPGEEHAAGMQVSRGVGLLHHQNLLDHPPQVPPAGLHSQGEIRPGPARGGGQSQPQQAAQVPEDQEAPLVPEALRHGPGVHGQVAQLLRGGRRDGQPGHAGARLQQDGGAARRRLRPDVLRPRLQHAPVLPRLAVQLQVLVVLLRQVQHLQREDRGVHVQVTALRADPGCTRSFY